MNKGRCRFSLIRIPYREKRGAMLSDNRFEPVEVKLGPYQFNERFQVLAGLSEGDEIVTSAGFLIDAESRLKSATSGMSGHQHGAGAAAPQKAPSPPPPKAAEEKKPGAEHEHHHHGD